MLEKSVTEESYSYRTLTRLVKFIRLGLQLEEVVGRLIELGYECLSDSDFDRFDSVQHNMSTLKARCFYAHLKKCHGCELETVEVWNPDGKIFLEMDFDYSGDIVLEKTKITTGKNLYSNQKAVTLANKFLFS